MEIWKRTNKCCKILIFFLFFSLSSLCQSLPPFFFSNTNHSSLILSYFLLEPSLLFHADADVDANASLPRQSLSSYGFSFFFFFFLSSFFFFFLLGCGLMGGLGDGWIQTGKLPSSTTQCRPPHTLRSPWFFFFFLWVDVG